MMPKADGYERLVNRQTPSFVSEQIERFTFDSLQAKPVRSFNPHDALRELRLGGNRKVVAIDIGGDKLIWSSFDISDGLHLQAGDRRVWRGEGGSGYLDILERAADFAHRKMLTVGISLAGPIDGTTLLASPNLPVFMAELYDRYSGDFADIFSSVELANDAEAGIMASALEAANRYPEMGNVIYVINGSGLGGAVLKDNMIFAAEPGHVEVERALNPFNQRKACGMNGAKHVCVEVVAASKAGIEDIWLQHKGERRNGADVAARYLNGDPIALSLYDNAALVTAHVVKGFAKAFRLPDDFSGTIVVGHGGTFKVPGFSDRLHSILAADLGSAPKMLFTKDFSANTCLDGAAIAALVSRLS